MKLALTGVTLRILLAVALLVPTSLLSLQAMARSRSGTPVVAEATLPETLGAWKGTAVPLTDSEKSMLDSPAASQRLYSDPDGNQVQVLLLEVNNTQNAHDPKLCMAGSGYSLKEEKILTCPWMGDGGYRVSRALFAKDPMRVTMYYWLSTKEGAVADMSSGLKLEGIKRALTGSSLRGIAVRVVALPNAFDPNTPTEAVVAEKFWQELEKKVDLPGLVAKL